MMKKDETFFEYPIFDNIRQVVYHSVSKYPNNIAFKIKEKDENKVKYIDITYTQFLEDVNSLGTAFYSIGLRSAVE